MTIAATQPVAETEAVLAESPIGLLMLYVHDLLESREFYERRLGLRVIEADEGSVKLDAGQVILWLARAADYGVTLTGRSDDASDLVFLVDDINAVRRDLEARGVEFCRRRTYEIGLVTDFYDPNGHRLMIYEPSEKALSWPSGESLRRLWRAAGQGGPDLIGPPARPAAGNGEPAGLDGKPLVYLFMFVPDSGEALAYYQGALGLNNIERVHCCNPACPPEEKGVAKYDAGGLLLATHHIHRTPVVDDFGRIYSPRALDPAHARGIVPIFLVDDVAAAVEKLERKGVGFGEGVVRSQIGYLAKFEAATGHAFILYEPWSQSLLWPTGRRILEILAAWRGAEAAS
ncbi:MAG TPA: VOC family protein [Thermoanaerobaculia bacterium]